MEVDFLFFFQFFEGFRDSFDALITNFNFFKFLRLEIIQYFQFSQNYYSPFFKVLELLSANTSAESLLNSSLPGQDLSQKALLVF